VPTARSGASPVPSGTRPDDSSKPVTEPAPGAAEPVRVREAATVVLLRDGASGLETWLLRRVSGMAFAAGMSVFPGGAVDADDANGANGANGANTALDGDDPGGTLAAVADQLNTDLAHAGALVCAAIRETFEEVGILLTRPPMVASGQARVDVENRKRTFSSLLSELGAQLDASAVRPWARWITPEGEVRRYDTYFFVAVVPEGSIPAWVTGEASHADWIPVATALAEFERGERPMLPPTFTTLSEIVSVSEAPTAAEVLHAAAQRQVRPVAPVFRRSPAGLSLDLGNGTVISLPDGFLSASGKKL
jgi:8-oxo-dGTP pyrophosphatase MutT (NUDIX family)